MYLICSRKCVKERNRTPLVSRIRRNWKNIRKAREKRGWSVSSLLCCVVSVFLSSHNYIFLHKHPMPPFFFLFLRFFFFPYLDKVCFFLRIKCKIDFLTFYFRFYFSFLILFSFISIF